MIYTVVNQFYGNEIEFESDNAELSIEVTVQTPSGTEIVFFNFTEDQTRKIKELIDKSVKCINQ